MSDTAAKKDIQKLQRAIVDGLEDVKAQDIRVFNTEHMTPLFERVIVASGNTNRQTKALAASVQSKVREAGLAKPRVEGEDNGEWIIVDCGPAVVHVMQPAIRQYYNLEEIWGEKPVRLKNTAAPKAAKPATKTATKAAAEGKKKTASSPAASDVAASKKVAAKKAPAAKKPAAKKAPASKTAATRPAARKTTAAKKTGAAAKTPARKAPLKAVVVNKPTAKSAAKSAAKPAARKSSARK